MCTFSVAEMNSWVMLYMVRNSCNFNLGWRTARTPRSFAHLPWAASHAAKTASAFSRNTSALFRTRFFENIKQIGQQLKQKVIAESKLDLKYIFFYIFRINFTRIWWIPNHVPLSSFYKRWNHIKDIRKIKIQYLNPDSL